MSISAELDAVLTRRALRLPHWSDRFEVMALADAARDDREAVSLLAKSANPCIAQLAERRRVVAFLAHPDLVKVGPHGYIHGWIYVGPGGGGSIGEKIDHPEHGAGTITHADADSVTVKHDSGEVKHYAASFAKQKPKMIATGSEKGKTHIANVKPIKGGDVVNRDTGEKVGHVQKMDDGSWGFTHEDKDGKTTTTGGFPSKHLAVKGLVDHRNADADKHAGDTDTPKPPKVESALKPTQGTPHADEPEKAPAAPPHEKATWQTIGPMDENKELESMVYAPAKDGTPGWNITHKPTGVIIGRVEGDIQSGYTGTHADGTVVHGGSMGAAKKLIQHHNEISGEKPKASEPEKIEQELSQGDAAHEALTEGDSKDPVHADAEPNMATDAAGATTHASTPAEGEHTPPDWVKLGPVDAGNTTTSYDAASGQWVVRHADTGDQIGTMKKNPDGSYAIHHADGTELKSKAGGVQGASKLLLDYHNAVMKVPQEKNEPEPHVEAPAVEHGAPKAPADWKTIGHLDTSTPQGKVQLKVDPDSKTATLVHVQSGKTIGTLTHTAAGWSVQHSSGASPMQSSSLSSAAKSLIEQHNALIEAHAQAAMEHAPAEEEAQHAAEDVKPAAGAVHAAKQPYEGTGHLLSGDVHNKFTPTGQDISTDDGTKIGSIDFKPGESQGYGSFTHADGTKKPINEYMSAPAKQQLLDYHNEKYGDVTPEKADYEKIGHVTPGHELTAFNNAGGKDVTTQDGTKLGTINFAEGAAQGYDSFTHADASKHSIDEYTSAGASGKLVNYHNEKYGNTSAPEKPAASAVTAAKAKPWMGAGHELTASGVTGKKTGELVDKKTKLQIGTVEKTDYGTAWKGTHADGTAKNFQTKKGAVQSVVNYHNMMTALHEKVGKDPDGELAKQKLLGVYSGHLEPTDEPGHYNYMVAGTEKHGSAIDNHDGTWTLHDGASGATWKHSSLSKASAQMALAGAHNKAIKIAQGKEDEAPNAGASGLFKPSTSGIGKPKPYTGITSPSLQATIHTQHTHLTAPITLNEKSAVITYTGSDHEQMNKNLVDAKTYGDQVPAGTVPANIHAALNKSELNDDMTLYRGVGKSEDMFGPVGSKVGKIDIQHSFMSTSESHDVAKKFAWGSHGVVITIHAPKGAKAMHVDSFSQYNGEGEVLFQHGTMYRVNSDYMGSDGKRHADITILGLSHADGDHEVYPKVENG